MQLISGRIIIYDNQVASEPVPDDDTVLSGRAR
jgi:hypothetical protein